MSASIVNVFSEIDSVATWSKHQVPPDIKVALLYEDTEIQPEKRLSTKLEATILSASVSVRVCVLFPDSTNEDVI